MEILLLNNEVKPTTWLVCKNSLHYNNESNNIIIIIKRIKRNIKYSGLKRETGLS